MQKCMYCHAEIPMERAMQICDKCGVGVWGKKQWEYTKRITNGAKESGNLEFNSAKNFKETA